MDNKIVLFANMKGGTGKTTLCELFANYAIDKVVSVMAFDADPQLSLYKDRQDDIKACPDAEVGWNVYPLRLDSGIEPVIERMRKIPDVVLVDCPGNIDNPYLQHLFRVADVVVMPFRYDRKNVRETTTFADIFRQLNTTAQILFVPNMATYVDERHASFDEARKLAYDSFGKYSPCFITPRVMERTSVRDSNTLF